ncbi:MAG: nucleotidyltransferase family protein [Alphaproteobacteria bacterium]|nr:nucleotidyltransferase family protein [Alphaproteobacteria bacterium]
MVLAAGLGTRLRPLTDHRPKPLVQIAGTAMIDHVLDRLAAAGVRRAVVNLHYRGDLLRAHLSGRREPAVVFSDETDALLETGGGVKQALSLLGPAPFFAINGDVFWLDGVVPALTRLARAFDPERTDALLLVQSTVSAIGYDGAGDYFLTADGALRRRRAVEVAPFAFAGVQLLHPRLFATAPASAFSLNVLYHRAEATGRLAGLRHDGVWIHIGRPHDLVAAEAALAAL